MTKLSFADGLKKVFEYHEKQCPEIVITNGELYDTVAKDGKDVPIFYYRYFNKFAGMHDLQLLGEPCALTVTSVDTESLQRILFRELYVAEYLVGAKIGHITSYRCGGSANIIIAFLNGAKGHFQLHSAVCGERQFRHELFTTEGSVCDRVVDTVIAQHALNVYTEDGYETYTDADIMLYGLTGIEQETAYAIYDIFEEDDSDKLIEDAKRLEKVVNLTLRDSKTYVCGEDF